MSPKLVDFLNFPTLQLLYCGLLADCSNVGFTAGTPGTINETLVITLRHPTVASSALSAAGGLQVRISMTGRLICNSTGHFACSPQPSSASADCTTRRRAQHCHLLFSQTSMTIW